MDLPSCIFKTCKGQLFIVKCHFYKICAIEVETPTCVLVSVPCRQRNFIVAKVGIENGCRVIPTPAVRDFGLEVVSHPYKSTILYDDISLVRHYRAR